MNSFTRVSFSFCTILFAWSATLAQSFPSLPANNLHIAEKNYQLKFRWLADSVNNRMEPHAAMLLPIKLPGCSKQFYMQFDTGSPFTLFYKGKMEAIQQKYPKIITLNDSAVIIKNDQFYVGSMQVDALQVFVKEYGSHQINWKDKNSIEIIGTFGVDFIENRVIAIDYPAKKFFTGTTIPENLSRGLVMNDFMFTRRSILLPASIKSKKSILFFDTGSSAYTLLTNKQTAELLAMPNAVVAKSKSKSWGRTMIAHTIPTSDSIGIADKKFPLHATTFMEGVSENQLAQMMRFGIGGLTGNQLFASSVLIIDTKTKKFGLRSKYHNILGWNYRASLNRLLILICGKNYVRVHYRSTES